MAKGVNASELLARKSSRVWERVKKASRTNFSIPDGTYVCQFVGATVGVSNDGKIPYVQFTFEVKRGKFAGTRLNRFVFIADRKNRQGEIIRSEEEQLETLVVDLKTLGIDVEQYDSLEEAIKDTEQLEGSLVRVRVKNWQGETNSGMNVFLQGVVETARSDEETEEEAVEASDEEEEDSFNEEEDTEEDEEAEEDSDELIAVFVDEDEEEEEEEEKPAKKRGRPAKK